MSGGLALVTGGAGFIGSHLVEALLAEGLRVRVLDDFSSGREENLAGCLERIELRRADLRDAGAVAHAVAGAEFVFHQAAVASVTRSVEEPLHCDEVNLRGTLGLLEAARRAGVRRLVFASSCAAYGSGEALPQREGGPARPASPYGLQKLAGEHYCRLYSELRGLDTVALRYFNVFGPRQNPDGEYAAVVPLFLRSALKGEPLCIHGDGAQTRDFVYVADVVRANRLAARAPGAAGQVVNVGSGRRTSVAELARHVQALAGAPLETVHGPPRPAEARHSQADLSLARELLGFAPAVALREGLGHTLESLRGPAGGGRRP